MRKGVNTPADKIGAINKNTEWRRKQKQKKNRKKFERLCETIKYVKSMRSKGWT